MAPATSAARATLCARCNANTTDGPHRLRAVQQRQPFFHFKSERFDPRAPQSFGAWHSLPLEKSLAFADRRQRQMCQAAPDHRWPRPILFQESPGVTPRSSIAISVSINYGRAPLITAGQNVRAQQQHRARFRFRKRRAKPACVTAHKIQLQVTQFSRLNADIGKLAEASVDAVNRTTLRHDLFDDATRFKATRTGSDRETYLHSTFSNICYFLKGEPLSVELEHEMGTGRRRQQLGAGNQRLISFIISTRSPALSLASDQWF